MDVTFSINSTELDEKFLKTIRELFEGKKIKIIISEEIDETEYLLKSPENKKRLLQAMEEYEKGEIVSLSLSELEEKYLKP